jgi:hypothetical protein
MPRRGILREAAIQRLRSKVEYTSLPAYLMPPEFTLPDLQRVYEIVLDRRWKRARSAPACWRRI